MKKFLFSVVILIMLFIFIKTMSIKKCPVSINDSSIIAPYAPKSQKNWWARGLRLDVLDTRITRTGRILRI